MKYFFDNLYPGRFHRSLTKGVFFLGQMVRYQKSPITLRINMGSNQRKLIIIDLKYLNFIHKMRIDVLRVHITQQQTEQPW